MAATDAGALRLSSGQPTLIHTNGVASGDVIDAQPTAPPSSYTPSPPTYDNTHPPPHILHLLLTSDCVCFDVDSTVSTEEGIDVLAAEHGVGEAVSQYTRNAMQGDIPFEVALEERLQLIQPTQQSLAQVVNTHPVTLTDGIAEVIALLHALHKEVYLVSGGFVQMIEPIAQQLHIASDHIIANRILFVAESGKYAGFDREAPTSRSGGKAAAVRAVKQHRPSQYTHQPVQHVVMVGDGWTDMEAGSECTLCIGYGGIAERAKVREGCGWWLKEWTPLIQLLREHQHEQQRQDR